MRVRMLVVAVLVLGGVMGSIVTPRRLADASTLVLMTDSLRHDGDLRYEPQDLARAKALALGDLPAGLMLIRPASGGYVYAKPPLYSLLALPWYAALGVRGFHVLNGLCLGILVVAGAALLAPGTGWVVGLAVAAAVHGFSVGPAYLLWIDPFLALSALVALGLLAHDRGWDATSGIAFGALASYRFPYLAVAAVPIAIRLRAGNRRAALRFAAAAGAAWLTLTAITAVTSGQWSPYTGPRAYYPTKAPFESAVDEGIPYSRDGLLARWRPPSPRRLATGLAHFVIGRYGGIALAFPTLLACLLWCRRWSRERVLWLAGIGGFALALELAIPHNRIGGQHALGNRFFVLLPLALAFVDPSRPRRWRVVASVALVLLVLPIVGDPVGHSLAPGKSMLWWPRRYFPFEWPLANHVSYPAKYGDLFALTDRQSSGADGTIAVSAGKVAEFVVVRPRGSRPGVRLWAPTPTTARVTNGTTTEELPLGPEPREVPLRRPMSVLRDEYGADVEIAVYRLAVAPIAGGPPVSLAPRP